MRTLIGGIAGVNLGTYQAVFRLKAWSGIGFNTLDYNHTKVMEFEIDNLDIKVVIPIDVGGGFPSTHKIQLLRGALVGGSESLVGTSKYSILEVNADAGTGRQTITASLIPRIRINIPGDDTYENVLTDFATACGLTASFKNPSANVWQYQFLPTGKSVMLNDAKRFIPLLRQKYLISVADIEGDTIQFSHLHADQINQASLTADFEDYFLLTQTTKHITTFKRNKIYYFWTDETQATHTDGDTTNPIWNLGYLESTDDPPDILEQPLQLSYQDSQVDLRLTTNDVISQWEDETETAYSAKFPISVKELFNQNHEPSWYMEVKTIDPFQNTEGGAMPSTIERISNYTPLNTSTFDGILSQNDNNLQAAMETIDGYIPDVTQAELDAVQANIDAHIADTTSVHAFSSLSGLPAAETNANDIFRVDSPGGPSLWTGTISGAPSGASVTVSAPVTGTEAVLVPTSTSQLAKMRLYNLTRGTSALISNYNTGTNVITLTANAPAAWANGDSLTVASNTVSGGGYNWIDLEITSGPTGKTSMFINLYILNATANQEVHMHAHETYAASKLYSFLSQVTNILTGGLTLQKITNNVVAIAWTGTPTRIVVREAGYLL